MSCLVVPRRGIQPSTARDSGLLDLRCVSEVDILQPQSAALSPRIARRLLYSVTDPVGMVH